MGGEWLARCLKGGWEKEAGKSSTAKRHMEESEKQRDEDTISGDSQCSREEDRKQQHTVSKKRPHVHVIYYSKYILKKWVFRTGLKVLIIQIFLTLVSSTYTVRIEQSNTTKQSK